ncbi:MAG TPA: response regulator [Planctomycetota bacterium]
MILPPVVLLVEDMDDDRLFFERAIRKVAPGVRLIHAADGQQAVDRLSGTGDYSEPVAHPKPTHVVLDLKLPKRSGMEVLEWMRTNADLPVIVLTSSQSPKEIERARSLGVDDYLVKPASFEKLVAIVRMIVAHWKL